MKKHFMLVAFVFVVLIAACATPVTEPPVTAAPTQEVKETPNPCPTFNGYGRYTMQVDCEKVTIGTETYSITQHNDELVVDGHTISRGIYRRTRPWLYVHHMDSNSVDITFEEGSKDVYPLYTGISASIFDVYAHPWEMTCSTNAAFADNYWLVSHRWSDTGVFFDLHQRTGSTRDWRLVQEDIYVADDATEVTVAEINTKVKITSFDATQQKAQVTFIVAHLPALSFTPSTLNVAIGSQQNITLNTPKGAPPNFSVKIAPENSNIAINNQSPGSSATIPVPQNTSSQTFTVHGVQAGTSRVTASGQGFESATMSVSVSPPNITLSLSNSNVAVMWGNAVNLTVIVEGQRGFAGPVDLTLENVPHGVKPSFAPATVNVPQNGTVMSTLILNTVTADTKLGPLTLRVKATPQTGSVARKTADFDLAVLRTEGQFDPVTLITNDSSCGSVIATVVATGSGYGVQFTGPPFNRTNPQTIDFSTGYAISPRCRISLVIPPVTLNTPRTTFWNLGFDPAIGADPLGRLIDNPEGAFINGYFSQDDSLFLLVTPGGAGTHHAAVANLYDLARGTNIGREFFTAKIISVELKIDTVTLYTNPSLTGLEWTVR